MAPRLRLINDRVTSIALAKRMAVRKIIQEFRGLIPFLVKERTKSGLSVNGNLPGLKTSTKKFRSRWKAFLANDTSPNESNLTATGQLLNAIVEKVSATKITISIDNKKPRDEGLGGSKGGMTNEKVREWVEKAGFKFFELSEQERAFLVETARNLMISELKKVFGT